MGANGGIHEFADSQFGHIFATGATREIARRHLVLALKSVEIRGKIRNPVEYLVELLETDDFKDNTIHTGWLDGILKAKSVAVPVNTHRLVLAAVVYRAYEFVKARPGVLFFGGSGVSRPGARRATLASVVSGRAVFSPRRASREPYLGASLESSLAPG